MGCSPTTLHPWYFEHQYSIVVSQWRAIRRAFDGKRRRAVCTRGDYAVKARIEVIIRGIAPSAKSLSEVYVAKSSNAYAPLST
ncbi:unnamed protein product, partial [Iphiclides podalirius]